MQTPIYVKFKEGIRESIESGDLSPGDKLPSERDLAAAHGLSRMTVRQALTDLVTAGIVITSYSIHYTKLYERTFIRSWGATKNVLSPSSIWKRSVSRVPSHRDSKSFVITSYSIHYTKLYDVTSFFLTTKKSRCLSVGLCIYMTNTASR